MFADTFYIELTVVAKSPPSQAWVLVGRCIAAVFSLTSPYRLLFILGTSDVVRRPQATCQSGSLHLDRVTVSSSDAQVHPSEFSWSSISGKGNELV
jgi:hypothetical protein